MEVNIEKTIRQYKEVIAVAKKIVIGKNEKYGQSWRVMRPFSILDQSWIKIARIRTIQDNGGNQKIEDETIGDDYYHIINYCIFGMIIVLHPPEENFSETELGTMYDEVVELSLALCKDKNHDYGEAWRELNISTMVDLMLAKHLRAKAMQKSRSLGDKDILEIFKDIMNYAVFSRIRINEGENPLF